MSEIILKIVGLAVFLGFVSVILPDGNVKGFAKMGIGLLFAATLLLPVTEFVRGVGSGNIAEYTAGRLRSLFAAAEIKEQVQGSGDNAAGGVTAAVIEEYCTRLSGEAAAYILEKTGILTEPSFVVCGDIASKDFGKLEYVHCKVIREPGSGVETADPADGESKKIKRIKKIEITLDGIYINGNHIFGKEDGSGSEEADRLEEEKEHARIREAVTDALRRFCGIEADQCNVFWE